MERFNRAERRAQVSRLKAKRKYYWGYDRMQGARNLFGDVMEPARLGKLIQGPQTCSNPICCGNARRFYGRPLSEVRMLIAMEEQTQEAHDDQTTGRKEGVH